MATLVANASGTIRALCPECGAQSSFVPVADDPGASYATVKDYGTASFRDKYSRLKRFQLYKCAACSRGAYAEISHNSGIDWARGQLDYFSPAEIVRVSVPIAVPSGIISELREAELCASVRAYRAAGALLRSVLEKTLKRNGYTGGKLWHKIEAAADDNVITQARKRRAQENIRVLGNDILHDDYAVVKEDEFRDAHHYTQRILEDFYDHREEVEKTLTEKNRSFVTDDGEADEEQ